MHGKSRETVNRGFSFWSSDSVQIRLKMPFVLFLSDKYPLEHLICFIAI